MQLIQRLADYEKREGPDTQAKVRLKRDGLSDNPKYEGFLGFEKEQVIGCITYLITYSTFLALPKLYIEDLFILEEFRRRGFAQQFFKFCIKQAQKRGCGKVEWNVLTWNEPAIKLYEKIGAVRQGWYFYQINKEDFTEFLKE
ncbi:MAG TPA: GNAT family N-acetyltransferase [Candidatus Deferrimicrobium sp.]|nr:GNAT family N-acetyltransferase [Candidatus Deferrimicrobium sp.]